MIEPDTIRLLRECDAGIKMGTKAIDDVLDRVESDTLTRLLRECRDEHRALEQELQALLAQYGDDGKDPNFLAEKMAKMKIEIKLQLDETDQTIAALMTDGCNMGVKSLSRYLNQYAAAEAHARALAKRLIDLEQQLALNLRKFL